MHYIHQRYGAKMDDTFLQRPLWSFGICTEETALMCTRQMTSAASSRQQTVANREEVAQQIRRQDVGWRKYTSTAFMLTV